MFKLRNIFSIDLRSLALFRITIGSLVLADLSIRSRDLTAHYTDSGIMPRSLLASTFGAVVDTSLYMINGTETAAILLFLATAVAAIAVTLGLHTRIATVLVWLLLVSLLSTLCGDHQFQNLTQQTMAQSIPLRRPPCSCK